ncbi:MAG: hypothetical protein JWO80_3451, partial [Bryobacterales bacterium]|nr:hypothetical protein [Bryobacterales bacterium]
TPRGLLRALQVDRAARYHLISEDFPACLSRLSRKAEPDSSTLGDKGRPIRELRILPISPRFGVKLQRISQAWAERICTFHTEILAPKTSLY